MKKILSLHPLKSGLINKLFLPFFFSFLIFDFASATDYYWHPSSGTTWGTLANWRTGSYSGSSATVLPTSSDNVFIGNSTNNFTVDLNINDTINDLSIIDGGQIFINTSASKVLYVMGNLTSSNSATTGGGSATIRMNSSGSPSLTGNSTATGKGKLCNLIIDVSGTVTLSNYITMGGSTTLTYTAGTVAAGTSTVAFYNANTISGSFTFYDVEFIGSSNTVTVSANQTVTHDVTLNGSSAITINSNQIDVQGNINDNNSSASSGGSTTFNLTSTNNQTISSSVSAGQGFLPNVKLSKSSGTVTLSGGVISIAGDWTNNYSYSSISYGTSELYFQKSAATVTLGGTYSTPVYKLTLNGNTTTYSLGRDSVFVVKNDLNFRNTSALTINSHNLYAEGNILLNNSNSSTGGSAEIVLHGAANQTITSNVSAGVGSLPNVKLQKSGGTVTLSGAITIGGSWTNNFSYSNISYGTSELYFQKSSATITIGGSYSTPVYRLTLNGNTSTYDFQLDSAFVVNDTFKLRNTGTYTISNHSIYAKGHIVMNNSNSSSAFNSTLYLKGTANQYLKGTNDLKVANLVINKSAGTVTLNKTLTVTGSVTFTNGNIVSSSTNLLIFNDNATVTGASDNSFVDGPVKKVGNDSFTYPTGKSGTYRSIAISAPSTTSDAFTAEYFGVKSSTTAIASPITYTDPCEYWNLTHTTGSATVNVTLGWSTPCFHIASLSYFVIGRDSSSKWVKGLGTFTTTGNTTTGTIASNTARSTWGDVTLAKTNALVTASAGADDIICGGSSASIGGSPTGSGGTSGISYSWSPSTGLSSSTAANPTCSASVNTTYIITVTDGISEYDKDTIVITSSPAVNAGVDKILCPGGDAYLGSAPTADDGTSPYSYLWSPSAGLDTATISNPLATPTATTTYTLTVTDNNGCTASDAVVITVSSPVVAHAGNDTTGTAYAHVKLGATVTSTGGNGNYSYDWSPSAYIDSPSIARPIAKLPRTETFTLYVEDENGCNDEDDITVTVSNPLPVIDADLGGIPFIENVGQVIDTTGSSIAAIKFKTSLTNSDLYIWDTMLTVTYAHFDSAASSPDSLYLMNISFDNANTNSLMAAAGDSMSTRGNYFLSYLSDFYTDVRTSRFISYENIYAGIDADLFNTGGAMNWHFVVDTIGNYTDISFNFQGADSLNLDTLGNVFFYTPLGIMWWAAPFATQTISGRTDTLDISYVISGNHLSLNITSYNVHHPIDIFYNRPNTNPSVGPVLDGIYMDWSSYFGGANIELFRSIDASVLYNAARVIACGNTTSYLLPIDVNVGNSFQSGLSFGSQDVIIANFRVSDRMLMNFTYYGGSDFDLASNIKKGPGSRIYFCGTTLSPDFPTQDVANPNNYFIDNSFTYPTNLGNGDGYVVALNNACLQKLWATYLKGNGVGGMAIDHSQFLPLGVKLMLAGNAFCNGGDGFGANCGGAATSLEFDPVTIPIAGAYNISGNSGLEDGVIMEFNINPGSAHYGELEWETYLGGSDEDFCKNIDVNDAGAIVVSAKTKSDDIYIANSATAPQPGYTSGGTYGYDGYIAYFNPLRQLVWSTYLGGSGDEGVVNSYEGEPQEGKVKFFPKGNFASFIDVGWTVSTDFPITAGPNSSPYIGVSDLYITWYKVPNLMFSTYFGSTGIESQGLGVDVPDYPSDIFYLVGGTLGNYTFPVQDLTLNSYFDGTYNGNADAFISRFIFDPSDNSFINQWSTFIGGVQSEVLLGVSDNSNIIFCVGETTSNDGTPIDGSGQAINGTFPLCKFDNINATDDFFQEYYSYPYNNVPPCANCAQLSNANNDAVIMAFVDPCGTSCYRKEPNDEIIKKDSIAYSEMTAFPNPTDKSFTIFRNQKFSNEKLNLYNELGALILSVNLESGNFYKMDLTGYSSGIYLIRIGNSTAKIIKQ